VTDEESEGDALRERDADTERETVAESEPAIADALAESDVERLSEGDGEMDELTPA